ncbi:MAG: type II toxin-antitoxin system VapC family toxin [Acidobacteria bacterium]|nr:type II toxin-antitoxin system VapC family toxin [Acidobacteriota bacterium]
MIILDTNVLSEVIKPLPSPQVVEWLARQPPLQVFTTAITQAEVLYGIDLVAGGKRRAALEAAADAMFQEDFAGRILPFDDEAARLFPKITVARRLLGRPISQFDAQIAAIARSRDAAIATRNTKDFEHCEVPLLNPWKGR